MFNHSSTKDLRVFYTYTHNHMQKLCWNTTLVFAGEDSLVIDRHFEELGDAEVLNRVCPLPLIQFLGSCKVTKKKKKGKKRWLATPGNSLALQNVDGVLLAFYGLSEGFSLVLHTWTMRQKEHWMINILVCPHLFADCWGTSCSLLGLGWAGAGLSGCQILGGKVIRLWMNTCHGGHMTCLLPEPAAIK